MPEEEQPALAEPGHEPRITVTENGPYRVEAEIPMTRQTIETNDDGESWDWREGETLPTQAPYRLCRCGGSSNKPFCDDTHLRNGFDGTETAVRMPYLEQADAIEGPELVLTDAEAFCAYSRFCDAKGGIWWLAEQPDHEAAELTERAAARCVSGRLVAWRKAAGEGPAEPFEPDLEPSIGVVEDPAAAVSGPLWVRGGIRVVSADATEYEVRNRVALCRCGASENKPFCDGSHASIGFQDESARRA